MLVSGPGGHLLFRWHDDVEGPWHTSKINAQLFDIDIETCARLAWWTNPGRKSNL